jgi:hypothetical protein
MLINLYDMTSRFKDKKRGIKIKPHTEAAILVNIRVEYSRDQNLRRRIGIVLWEIDEDI